MAALVEKPAPTLDQLNGTGDRPPIAHLPRDGGSIALCGTPMRGIPAPPEVDRCIVCADLGGVKL